MSYLDLAPGLNRADEISQLALHTHKGMAHFAGTGPAGRTCRECVFWSQTGRWFASGPQPAKCARYFQLTHSWGPKVPHNAWSCKHFEAAERPQTLHRPKVSVFDK